MQTVKRKDSGVWDIDALLELPEMKVALDEFRDFQSDFRNELWLAFLETDDDELPDVKPLNEKYDSRLRELKERIRAIAEADRG